MAAMILLAGCGADDTRTDDLAPSAPQWVPRSADNIYPQQGVRAEPVLSPSDHWVRLEWYANPEPDVMGYRILRAPESDLNRHAIIEDLRVGMDLPIGVDRYSGVDAAEVLTPDPVGGDTQGFFWELVAYDSSENQGPLSEPVYFRLINNPYSVAVGRASEKVYEANWLYNSNPDVIIRYYMLRVYSHYWGPDSVVWYSQVQRYGSPASVTMDFRQSSGPLVADCTYVCQINVVSDLPSGQHADSLAGAAVYALFSYQN